MKTTFAFVLLIAASLAAQEMSSPTQKQSAASHRADVEQHGDHAMGFSHARTTHHFLLYPDGGAIEATANDPADSESVQQMRTHLTHIAGMFADGNFSAPMFVHSQVPPGVPVMRKDRVYITYTFKDLPAGASVLIKSNNAEAIDAVHKFLQFQIDDHHTGDSGKIVSPSAQ